MGNDILYAGEGNNTLYGGTGNDTLYAGAGNDIIYAGEGDNILYGGIGNNTLYSGSGSDLFALSAGIGASAIVNFDIGKDLLGLSGGLTFGQLSITQGTNGDEFFTQIGVAGSSDILATLDWVQANTITSSSFTIV